MPSLASEGDLAWARRAGGSGSSDETRALAAGVDGSVIAVGCFKNSATFGQGEAGQTVLSSKGNTDVFVAKYNADGLLVWAKSAGSSGVDWAAAAAADSDGTILVAGTFSNLATFGKGEANQTVLTSAGSTDIFVARYNADGTLAWAKRAGSPYADEARGLAILPGGGFAITGHFQNTAVFGKDEVNQTSLRTAGYSDVFVAKYNANGTLERAWRAGGTDWDYASGIVALPDGSTAITGDFQGTSVFGKDESNETSLVSAGNADIFAAMFDPDGLLVWAKRAGGNRHDYGRAIGALSDGSVAVVGDFMTTATFGPGEAGEAQLVSAGASDAFLARFSGSDGTLAWAKRAGSSNWDYGYGLAVLTEDRMAVVGDFQGDAHFGPGEAGETVLTSAGGYDAFMCKYEADGTLARAKQAGGTGNDAALAVAGLALGRVAAGGYFEDTATFGPGEAGEVELNSAGARDLFLCAMAGTLLLVDADAVGANNGSSWENAFTDLQSAIAAAVANRPMEIWVAEGTYKPTAGADRTKSFVLKAGIPVYGGFAGTETLREDRDPAANVTVLSGDIGVGGDSSDNSYHVVTGADGATLDGFTVTGGNANGAGTNGYGGGLYIAGFSMTVAYCTVTANGGVRGAGGYLSGSHSTFTDCVFSTNIASALAGAIYLVSGAPQFTRCTFSGNKGTTDGAVRNRGTPTFTACSFVGNSGTNGGGIYNETTGAILAIDSCTFSQNSATNGGAIFSSTGAAMMLAHCLFVHNTATYGGGIYNYRGASSTVNSCTFRANKATAAGGAIYNFRDCSPTVKNCILWGDTAPTGSEIQDEPYSGEPSSTIAIYSDIQGGWAGVGNINAVPYFASSVADDYHLKSHAGHWAVGDWVLDSVTSPCIDAGNPADSYANEPEPNGGRINMGAYGNTAQASKSSGIPPPAAVFVNWAATGSNDGSSWTDAYTDLQAAIIAASGMEIWVAKGTYKPTTGVDRTTSFVLQPNVLLYGGFAGTETLRGQRNIASNPTILSGDIGVAGAPTDNSYHVVTGAAGAIMDGFTVTGGNADGTGSYAYGGGLCLEDISMNVIRCAVVANRGALGGGGYLKGSATVFSDCVFSGNVASSLAGAVYIVSGAPEFIGCTFTGNTGTTDGAVRNRGTPTFDGCSFISNTGTSGGGIYSETAGATLTLDGCTLSQNAATNGGAIFNANGAVMALTNCLVVNNTAKYGGGVYNYRGAVAAIINSTFSANGATAGGGAVYNFRNCNPALRNCILWNDTAPLGAEVQDQPYTGEPSVTTVTFSDVRGSYAGVGNINADPLFVDAASGDYHLKSTAGHWTAGDVWVDDASTSPCIDAGDPADGYANEPENNGDRINIGAYGNTEQASKTP